MKKRAFWLLALVTLLDLVIGVAASCVTSSPNYSLEGSQSDVWTDPTSGLTWQVITWQMSAPYYSFWSDAKAYCMNLSLGGHNDWRLPTISELRSLIRGCPATQTGGSCGVTDSCVTSNCRNDACVVGCAYKKGPAREGRYWSAELADNFYSSLWSFWSSSLVTDDDVYAWEVDFSWGRVIPGSVRHADSDVRCVRP